jgi:tRNA threonylcarbamoyladenosine biosynthesis protein TsaE
VSDLFIDHVCGEDGVKDLVGRLSGTLATKEPYVVWLDGPMGSGKTTLVRNLLWHMGLNENVPVTSPTYTLMNEYEIGGKWYAHLDLYRADALFSLEELGVLDAKEFVGVFVEWAEVPDQDSVILPTHKIKIRYQGEKARRYSFEDV